MTTHPPFSDATDSPSRSTPLGLPLGEGLGRRVELVETVMSNLTKRQIEVTMFACGVEMLGRLEGWEVDCGVISSLVRLALKVGKPLDKG